MGRITEDRDASGDPTRDAAFRRSLAHRGAGRAVDDLAADVTGPVHDPYGVDAAVELAGLVDTVPADLVAVLGAVDSADVATAVRWATAHDVAVAVPTARRAGIAPRVPASRRPPGRVPDARPTLVVTCRRVDRVVVDVTLGTARVGVGAAWSAVRSALRSAGLPDTGLVGDGRDRLVDLPTLCGATVVTADGILWRVDDEEEPELWERVLRGPAGDGRGGVVTELELALG